MGFLLQGAAWLLYFGLFALLVLLAGGFLLLGLGRDGCPHIRTPLSTRAWSVFFAGLAGLVAWQVGGGTLGFW